MISTTTIVVVITVIECDDALLFVEKLVSYHTDTKDWNTHLQPHTHTCAERNACLNT